MEKPEEILERIESALEAARQVFEGYSPGAIEAEYKAGHDPVTEADRAVDTLLHKHLVRSGEGWLSEERPDDLGRLESPRVWVVDPLDGTREFVAGIPEYCIAVAFVENGCAVAGGICNPATREIFLGSVETGTIYNGKPARATDRTALDGASVLASRSEISRGEWKKFQAANLIIKPVGSVAYKLALVAAGLADATFTLVAKHEWDVAAGAALVTSAGGFVRTRENQPLRCNRPSPRISGLLAGGAGLQEPLLALLAEHLTFNE
jgi:myo-inositol-1(or 4)-monophosphatase